jgi:CheY-like chemotaxis protein
MAPCSILLAEDEANSVIFFEYAMKKLEMQNPLHVVTDGGQAIDYLDGVGPYADRVAHPIPGLVVLDLKMPRATGFEVLRHIRQKPELLRLIVVMHTASASESDVTEAYALGANAYLVKPSQLEDLVKMVQALRDFWLTHNLAARCPG